jgi:hypothetical protein
MAASSKVEEAESTLNYGRLYASCSYNRDLHLKRDQTQNMGEIKKNTTFSRGKAARNKRAG